MSVHRFQPQPFFADKNRAFWNLQSVGWAGAFLLRGSSTIANGQPLSSLIPVMISTVSGYSVTLLIAVVFRFLQRQRPIVTWGASIVTVVVAAGLVAFIDAWVFSTQNRGSDTAGLQLFLGAFYLSMTLLGAWSALYYAINFYLTVEEQADQLLRLENQASSAQLAMLRYQLNPHFLFNTLNSISTLVLLKQTEPANAMLTRLSGFLRHTLVSQPGGKVTVAQEVETLKLYLDIERMRFEERLRTVFSIDPAAADAVIPSFLLQPLVENAIKYAVSPQEEGARISLSAQLVGNRIRLAVSDTGPGLRARPARATLPATMKGAGNTVSTGVGLANIRDRLAQAYGDDHLFDIRTPPEGGFTVVIEVPYERQAAPEKTPAALEKPSAPPTVTPAPAARPLGLDA